MACCCCSSSRCSSTSTTEGGWLALLAVLVALADGGFTIALGVLAVVVGVQALEGNVIEPLITGRMVRLRPFVVIVVLVDLERQRRDALLVLLDQLRLVLRADVEGGERVAVAVLVDQLGEPVTLVR